MKNNLKYVVIFVMSCLVMISCKKKDDNTDPYSAPFAKESVSDGKTSLDKAGSDMVTELKTMENASGIEAVKSLGKLNPNITTSSVLKAVTDMNISEGTNVFSKLRAGLKTSDDTTFQQVFNSNTGVYTWNSTSKIWVKTTATDRIEYDFPSTETGTTNNAKLVITYKGKAGISIIEGYHGDMPLNLNASLYVNSTKVAETDLTASYNSDGTPASVAYFIALYPFKVQLTVTYNSSSASVKYSFTDNDKVVVECYAGVNGNLSKTNIQNVSDNDGTADEIITNANAYFQVFNIKLAGKVDYKALAEFGRTMDNNTTLTEEQMGKAFADEYNKDMALVLIYADSKQKIAQAEAYYSPTDQNVEVRFIFADGSKGDLKTYFSTGFQGLVNDINSFITEVNTDFDTNIQPVQYPPK